jgi:hypothetical protein
MYKLLSPGAKTLLYRMRHCKRFTRNYDEELFSELEKWFLVKRADPITYVWHRKSPQIKIDNMMRVISGDGMQFIEWCIRHHMFFNI